MKIALRRFRVPGSLPPGSCAPGPFPGANRLPGQAPCSFYAPGPLPGETRLPEQALRSFCAPGPLPGETRLSEDKEDEENKVDEEDLCSVQPKVVIGGLITRGG
nr:uncharacterized protein LOC124218073 [Neodiprion pinetum]